MVSRRGARVAAGTVVVLGAVVVAAAAVGFGAFGVGGAGGDCGGCVVYEAHLGWIRWIGLGRDVVGFDLSFPVCGAEVMRRVLSVEEKA